MREQSRLVTSLESEKADIDTRLRVANAAHRLIGDEAIQFIFQEMEDNLSIVGGKAAHFGELHTAVKKLKLEAKLPEDAFAIPFAFYESHIKEGGIDKLIKVLGKK